MEVSPNSATATESPFYVNCKQHSITLLKVITFVASFGLLLIGALIVSYQVGTLFLSQKHWLVIVSNAIKLEGSITLTACGGTLILFFAILYIRQIRNERYSQHLIDSALQSSQALPDNHFLPYQDDFAPEGKKWFILVKHEDQPYAGIYRDRLTREEKDSAVSDLTSQRYILYDPNYQEERCPPDQL